MIFLLILELIASQSFPEGYYSSSGLKSEMELVSENEDVSLIEIGRSVEDRPIRAIRMNASKEFNCLIIGGIHSNEHASVLQVMEIMKEALELRDSINANIWFVPLLNVDGYAGIEEYFAQGMGILEISKNQRDTKCLSLVASGIDLNYNFPTRADPSNFSACHEHYQGSKAFSEPESQSILQLVSSFKFHMIISYFSGSTKYLIPKSYSTQFSTLYSEISKLVDVEAKDQTGSLTNWAADMGILSISAYVSHEHRPSNFDFLQRNKEVFFNILAKIGSDFKYFATQEGNRIEIYIENQGFFRSNDAPLAVTCSVGILEALLKYKNQQEAIELENLKEVSFVLKNILPHEHVAVILTLEPTNNPVEFEILINNKRVQRSDEKIDFREHWTVNESGFAYAKDPFFFGITSLCLVLLGFIVYCFLIQRLKDQPIEIHIPKRTFLKRDELKV